MNQFQQTVARDTRLARAHLKRPWRADRGDERRSRRELMSPADTSTASRRPLRCRPFIRLRAIVLAGVIAIAATGRGESPLRFTDVTLEAGIEFVHTIGDDKLTNIVEAPGVGCALLDYDHDGWLDIYLVNGVHLDRVSDPEAAHKETLRLASDRLYRNRRDGTFEDVTSKVGILPGGYGMGVVAADYDNDGDCDIYVTNYGANRLYRNIDNERFEEVAKEVGVADEAFGKDKAFGVGSVFFDYDGDGDLDLYVGNYLTFDPNYRTFYAPDAFPPPTAYLGQANHLYRNEGNGRFTDVTTESEMDVSFGRTMGVSAFDYDDDNRPDLFVCNDAMENHLLHNLGGGKFEDVAMVAGVAYGLNGEATGAMGAEIGDVNGDGRLDVYVPDFTFTCLYANLGDGLFEDRARQAGISVACGQYVSWGAALADFDLDTDLDLFVANGDAHHLEGHEDLIFTNNRHGQFTDVSSDSGPSFREKRVGRGVAAGDFDNDGDVDLLVVHLNDRPVLLRNDSARNGRHWLMINLVGRHGLSNLDALGARVRCKLPDRDGKPQFLLRELTSGGSYLCMHDRRIHFGLGSVSVVPEIEIRWPNGSIQTLHDVKADQVLSVQQPPRDTDESRDTGEPRDTEEEVNRR